MVIKVCIGSACHLKGSYDVIKGIERYIKDNNLDDSIDLKSSFCLGQCAEAVSVEIDQKEIISVSPDTVREVMDKLVKG